MLIVTKTTWDRQLTTEELEYLYQSDLLNDYSGVQYFSNPFEYPKWIIRSWNTLEEANNWIGFVSTFTPPPISAEVLELTDEEVAEVIKTSYPNQRPYL